MNLLIINSFIKNEIKRVKIRCKVETASIFYSDDCDEASRKIIEKPKIKLIEYSSNDERESQIFKVNLIRQKYLLYFIN